MTVMFSWCAEPSTSISDSTNRSLRGTAKKALKILERADGDYNVPCPDFAVVDLNLPRFGGIQILERLRKTPRCAGAPVIIFTSSDSPQDKAAAFRLGANRYFEKPTDLEGFMKLGKLVKEILPQPAC